MGTGFYTPICGVTSQKSPTITPTNCTVGRSPMALGKVLEYPPGNESISHLGKRKIIFKSAFLQGCVSSQEVIPNFMSNFIHIKLNIKGQAFKNLGCFSLRRNLRPQVLPRFISKVLNKTPSLSWQLRFYWSFQGGIWVDRTTWKFNKKHWSSSGIHLWKLTWRWKTIHLKMYLPLKMVDFILPILVFGGVCGIDI